MLNLPKQTEVNKFLPKEKLSAKLTPALKESLKNDVRRFTITHELSEASINMPKSECVSAVFVIEIALKGQKIDRQLIEAVAKQIPHKILFVLRRDDEAQLAVFHGRLYSREWISVSNLRIDIIGLNFDEVWENIVRQVAIPNSTLHTQNSTLSEALHLAKLQTEIARLEKSARSEKQPKRKFELVGVIDKLKNSE